MDENYNLISTMICIFCFSPNNVSTLWGSYGRSKEWCPSQSPFTAAFDCTGSRRVPFATTVYRTEWLPRDFWIVLPPGVRARFDAKRGFT